ncbi:MAG: PAS domain-containing protein, partial [Dehalococcoidia bacterium]|nr:PAS domain-containing protein [Dehalococcoidia bacterium]
LPGVVYRYRLRSSMGRGWVDSRIRELTGYDAAELVDGSVEWLDLVPEDERSIVLGRLDSSNGDAFDVVYSIRHRSGELRLIRDTGHVIAGANGQVAEVEGILFDVTERMERERVLREAWMAEHERYELVVQASRQVVHEWIEGSEAIYWGGSMRDVLGYAPEAHGDRFRDWLDRVHPDDRERLLFAGRETRAQRLRLRNYEYRYCHADGSYRWIWNHILYEWRDDGRARRIVGVMQDVTGRKQLEAQVHSAQRMETIGALAGGVAHDVNNYLTTVLGNIDLALMRVDEPWEELIDARAAVQGCAELVRSLLTFARQQVPARTQLNAAEVVTHAVRILARLVGPSIQLQQRTEAGLWFEADAVQVQQVLMNLVVNARDAMGGQGYIVLSAERASGGFIRFSVQDSGPGVALDLAERIFEPYFSTRPLGEGTGLGLSIVHGVAKAHGGRVEVANHPGGRGAMFSVYFPAA